jgi:hypothetical protein
MQQNLGFGLILYMPPLWWVGAILLIFAVIVTIAIFGAVNSRFINLNSFFGRLLRRSLT